MVDERNPLDQHEDEDSDVNTTDFGTPDEKSEGRPDDMQDEKTDPNEVDYGTPSTDEGFERDGPEFG